MHSHDRTLLASLGFADPDKKNPRHTLACKYLSQPEVALRLAAVLWPGSQSPVPERLPVYMEGEHTRAPADPPGGFDIGLTAAECEVPLFKSHGYLVGFWDVRQIFGATLLGWSEKCRAEMGEREVRNFLGEGTHVQRYQKGAWYDPASERYQRAAYAWIEVKAAPVDVADIARQIALYEPFTPNDGLPGARRLVVATCYPMPAIDKQFLAAKGVRHVWLGAPFEEWCKRQEQEQTPEDEGL